MATKYFSPEHIVALDQAHRANFINCLGGFKSVVLVGTRNIAGDNNLAIFSSFFHIGASPPLCGLIFRPAHFSRHTLENIIETGEYTVNHLTETIFKQAHQTAIRFDRSVSEFEATGLDFDYYTAVKAPYVRQSRIKFGMKMIQRVELEINGTLLLIGKIEEAFIPEECIGPDGFIDIEMAGTVTVSGLDSYHTTSRLGRLSHPRGSGDK